MNFARCPFNFREGRESKIVPLPLKSTSFVTAFLLPPPRIGQYVQTETAVQMQKQMTPIIFPVFLCAHELN